MEICRLESELQWKILLWKIEKNRQQKPQEEEKQRSVDCALPQNVRKTIIDAMTIYRLSIYVPLESRIEKILEN
jgi:hypothetical protein